MKRPVKRLTPHEVREKSHDDFTARDWQSLFKRKDAILSGLQSRGLTFSLRNDKNLHVVITGRVREVHFYGTTGTVYAPANETQQEYRLRGASLEACLDRVAGLSNCGY